MTMANEEETRPTPAGGIGARPFPTKLSLDQRMGPNDPPMNMGEVIREIIAAMQAERESRGIR